MLKHKIIFILTFIGAFLVAPIYISTYIDSIYVGGVELGIKSSWKFFGGFMLLRYTFYDLFGQFIPLYGYFSYFGELHFLLNFILLIFTSFLVARSLTFLFIQTYKQNKISIFWSTPYLKKLFKQVVTSVAIGIIFILLTSFIFSSTSLENWLYFMLISFITLATQSFRGNIMLTKLQKSLLLFESMVFVLGIIGLSSVVLYFFLS